MIGWLKSLVGSKYFFIAILVMFAVNGLWMAKTVKYGIPADEVYHYQFANYYANQPLFSGPVVNKQPDSTFYLGDLEREPNFLYHYLLSFPLRASMALGASEQDSVLFLRIINVILALGSLIVLRKIFENISQSPTVTNGAIFLSATTGMFGWIAAAVNYDNLSILLFFALIAWTISFIKTRNVNALLLALILSITSVIVKLTISPSVLLIVLLTTGYLLINRANAPVSLSQFWGNLKSSLNTPKTILLVLILILSLTLFSERIIGNELKYGTISPKCDTVHTQEQCLNSAIYRRDATQKVIYQESLDNGKGVVVKPLSFTKDWLTIMHDRLYFYFGHKTINADTASRQATIAFVLFLAISIVVFLSKRVRSPFNGFDTALLFISIIYIALLFYFNLDTYLSKGFMPGFQGRYLLPIMPFLYYLALKVFSATSQFKTPVLSSTYSLICIGVIGWFCWAHLPPSIFLKYTNADWYTSNTQTFNTKLSNAYQNIIKVGP